MNKIITTLLAAAGIAAAAPASAVVVGGVDFGTLGGAPSRTHLETATLAQTFITAMARTRRRMASSLLSMVTIAIARTEAAIADCITWRNSTIHKTFPRLRRVTSSTVSVFFSNSAPINLLVNNSPTNLAAILGINGGNPWVTLTGHNNLGGIADPSAVLNGAGLLTGSTLSGAASDYLM